MTDELIPCPGCERRLHVNAIECPQCGFRSEAKNVDEFLGSLSMVSSILVGFTLAALVSLVAEGYHTLADWRVHVSTGCWMVASILYLHTLIGSELLRRQEMNSEIHLGDQSGRVWNRCEGLFYALSLAALTTAVGVVILAFHFSPYHGAVACAVAAICLIFLYRMFTS